MELGVLPKAFSDGDLDFGFLPRRVTSAQGGGADLRREPSSRSLLRRLARQTSGGGWRRIRAVTIPRPLPATGWISGRRAAQVECRDQLLSRKPRADELCRIPRRRLAHRQRRHRSRLQRTHQVPVLPQRDALETRVWGADFATSRNQALTTMGQLLGECYAASYVVVHQGEITPLRTISGFQAVGLQRHLSSVWANRSRDRKSQWVKPGLCLKSAISIPR